jgi:AraC-like DNA-binding protein
MWQNILNIHPDCQEDFFNFDELPGNANDLIACAGISTLRTEYKIGNTGKGIDLDDKSQKRVNVHYLLATKSGQGKIRFENKEIILNAGSLVLLPAGTPFQYELDGESWNMCWLLLRDCQQYKFIHKLHPEVSTNSDANKIYQSMALIREFNSNDNGGDSRYKSDIILRLVEILLFQIAQTLDKKPPQKEQQLKFHAVIKHATKQLQRPWTVASLAAKMHISEPQFYRLCKKETGMTPIKLLTRSRLEYSCYLLRYTNYNLEQIAFTIGYADAASFSHRFKQHYQLSPGHWRNKHN